MTTTNPTTNPTNLEGPIMATVIDTPEGIAFFQLLAFRGRFQLEVNHGMTSRRSTLAAYNDQQGTNFRTKAAALADVCERIHKAKVDRIILNEARGWLTECWPDHSSTIAAGDADEVQKWIEMHFVGGWHEFQSICEPLITDIDED